MSGHSKALLWTAIPIGILSIIPILSLRPCAITEGFATYSLAWILFVSAIAASIICAIVFGLLRKTHIMSGIFVGMALGVSVSILALTVACVASIICAAP